jgi:hypothetical protein
VAVGFGLFLPRLRRVDSLDPAALIRDHRGASRGSGGGPGG